jgi:hypothetical protein
VWERRRDKEKAGGERRRNQEERGGGKTVSLRPERSGGVNGHQERRGEIMMSC